MKTWRIMCDPQDGSRPRAVEVVALGEFSEVIDGVEFHFGLTVYSSKVTLTEFTTGMSVTPSLWQVDEQHPIDEVGFARAILASRVALHGAPVVRKRMESSPRLPPLPLPEAAA